MNGLGLSAEQVAARARYVQAGDADRIMRGEWVAVWREKVGQVRGEDLAGVLPVQLGSMTEPFNLAWCERVTGRPITYYSGNPLMCAIWIALTGVAFEHQELQVSKTYPFMACNLDGMTTTPQGRKCPIDAKHVGRADDPMILRYTAAGIHQATVMGCDWWALSVLIGNSRHEVIYQETDPIYQATLIAKEREFWGYVERGEEPEDRVEPTLPPAPQPKLRTIVVPTAEDEVFAATMRQNNWLPDILAAARKFADTDGAAKANAIAKAEIRDTLPADVGMVSWGLFKAARDKAGAVRISLKKGEDDAE